MVAKSYQNLETIGEPFTESGRMYINVKKTDGSIKKVRWYSDTEYKRMYKEDAIDYSKRNMRHIMGFGDDGYITIFKGNAHEDNEYFLLCQARYTTRWGWYFPSSIPLPDDLPDDVEPVRLPWSAVGEEDGSLKSAAAVKEAVENLIYDNDPSEFQGNIGDSLNITVTIEQNISLDGYYGPSSMHVMRDADRNCYVWTTSAKNWAVGTTHHITGKVKEHKAYHNINETVLNYCKEVS